MLSRVWLFETPWAAAHQASLSITSSQSLLKLMCIELVMPSSHLILCCPLLPPSVSQHQGLQMSQLFASGGQSIGVSASTSVLSVNTQDWSPLGWTGWISLWSKGMGRSCEIRMICQWLALKFFGLTDFIKNLHIKLLKKKPNLEENFALPPRPSVTLLLTRKFQEWVNALLLEPPPKARTNSRLRVGRVLQQAARGRYCQALAPLSNLLTHFKYSLKGFLIPLLWK